MGDSIEVYPVRIFYKFTSKIDLNGEDPPPLKVTGGKDTSFKLGVEEFRTGTWSPFPHRVSA